MDPAGEDESPWGDVPSSSRTSPKPPAEREQQNGNSTEPQPTPTATSSSSARRGPRGKRPPAPAAKLESVDDPLGPLGGGGAPAPATQHAPAPAPAPQPPSQRPERPQDAPQESPISPPPSRGRARIPATFQNEDDGTTPRMGQAPQQQSHGVIPRVGKQSMSVEQASKPNFIISVGDPHKVGDLTGSHTVYQVRTRTTSKAYRNGEFEVSRRYRDFLWLYNQLHSNNPGVIVPPPPEKQITNRFETNFVESRRAALERMLQKTTQHPILQHDGDLKLFLESESFNIDKKERKDPDMPESKGMFSSLNLSVGSSTKFIEHDDWFLDRRVYLDTLEGQLKALQRSCETAIEQRKSLATASGELANSLNTLAQVEISPSLSGPLASLSDVENRIRDLYDRQAQQDVLTLGIVIDEYIRLIGSIKKAFDQRQRSWSSYHNAESDLTKRRTALDKLMRQGRTQQDKMSQLQADVGDAERRCHQMRLQFDDLGRQMRQELERFEREKVEDFKNGVETYLEGAVEAQKELIELWEGYLALLDADEEEEQTQTKTGANLPARTAGSGQAPERQPPSQNQPAAASENDRPGTSDSVTPPPTARNVEQEA
ncbi:MAG: hypothetical protein Q9162_001756 [Coniocarpon cinnabarinum]